MLIGSSRGPIFRCIGSGILLAVETKKVGAREHYVSIDSTTVVICITLCTVRILVCI